MDEKTYGARTEANRSPPGSARWRMRGAGRPSASPGPRSARASPGWCGCSGYPRPARRGRPAAGARRREPGVIRLGEPLARISPPGAVRAEDQPRPLTRPDRDQRGQRHPRVMAAGHRHHRGLAAAAPGAGLRRPQALAGLVFPAEPGAQVRRRAFMTGQVSSRHLAIFSSSRSAARRAGTCTDHPIRCSSTSIPPACTPPRTAARPDPRPAPASSTDPGSPRPPARHPAPPPARRPAPRTTCTSRRPHPWRPAPPGRRPPARGATGSRSSATPGTASRPPGRRLRSRSSPRRPAAPAPGGPAPPRPGHRHRDTSSLRHSSPGAGWLDPVTPAIDDR